MERLLWLELVKPWSCKRCGMGSRLILIVPKHFSCKSLWKTPLIQSLMNVRERAVYRVKNSESIRMLGSQSCLWFFSLGTANQQILTVRSCLLAILAPGIFQPVHTERAGGGEQHRAKYFLLYHLHWNNKKM